VHAGTISGGAEFSTYPASCLLQAERRTVPGETLDRVEAELRTLLGSLAGFDGRFRGEWRTVASREPFEIPEDEKIVRLLDSHAGAVEHVGASYWTDAALIAEQGIPTVVFGPGGEGAHADVEWVSIDDVERCADVFLAVATEFCA
jgi:acetylornithine deacetylase